MDNRSLEEIKTDLDKISDIFSKNVGYILINTSANERTSELISDICSEVSDALEQMANDIKEAIELMSK